MAVIYTRGRALKTAFTALFVVVAFPGYYTPLAPVFKLERNLQRSIGRKLSKLVASDNYQLMHCRRGAVVLKRISIQAGTSPEAAIDPRSCSWLN